MLGRHPLDERNFGLVRDLNLCVLKLRSALEGNSMPQDPDSIWPSLLFHCHSYRNPPQCSIIIKCAPGQKSQPHSSPIMHSASSCLHPWLAFLISSTMKHDFVDMLRRVVCVAFAPVVTDGICKDRSIFVKRGCRNRSSYRLVALEPLASILIPEMKCAV